MPWNRKEHDPLEARRRQLAEAERNLLEQRRRLAEQLHGSPAGSKPVEPPVWRMEEDARRAVEPSPARKRHLARQRQRDMVLFFIFIAVLLIVLVAVYWIASSHGGGTGNGV